MIKGLENLHTITAPDGHIRQGFLEWINYGVDFWFSEGGKIFWGDTKFWTVRKTPPLIGKLVVTNG